jgi:signal recognition particle receptor subunit beta
MVILLNKCDSESAMDSDEIKEALKLDELSQVSTFKKVFIK